MNSEEPQNPIDIAAIRAQLASRPGRPYWRGLDELARTPVFQEYLRREFPRQAAVWKPSMDRRAFLTLMGASLALAGLSGCTNHQPHEPIVPYVDPPDGLEPGIPLYFATAFEHNGYGTGVVVTSREGRPIKIEGNPTHPASLGATDAIIQASLLTLYDPDRSQSILNMGRPDTWDSFLQAITKQMIAQRATGGAGLRLLTESMTSPTLTDQLHALLAEYPAARWCSYEPIGRDNTRAGAQAAFGQDVNTLYRFDKAKVVLSLDADFLLTMPGHVRYARDFSQIRHVRADSVNMNRLYVAESTPTITGAMADHRLALLPEQVAAVAQEIAGRLGAAASGGNAGAISRLKPDPAVERWIDAVVADLQAQRGASLVVVGERQPAAVHALAHTLNNALGNVGQTVDYTAPIEADAGTASISLAQLVQEMRTGQVQTLVMLDTNPVYTAPADFDFAEALSHVPFNVHLGCYEDETAALCQWHIPQTHYLEAWSDTRAHDGTITIIQPLIAPFYATKTSHEIVAAMALQFERSNHDIVRDYWQKQSQGKDFVAFWRSVLNDGIVPDSAAPVLNLKPVSPSPLLPFSPSRSASLSPLLVVFAPDPTLWDGRYANNGWLQELPKPLSKLTWDNAVLMSPRTAEAYGVLSAVPSEEGTMGADVVTLRYRGRTITGPAWVLPGHPDGSVTVFLGSGRTKAGNVGSGVGFNAYALRTSDALWSATGVELHKTGERTLVACTHSHHTMEGRDIVRAGSITQFIKRDHSITRTPEEHEREERPPSIYPDWHYPQYAWAMSIDLSTCIGCNACVVACQAENNIPAVGRHEVLRGREMHWIRIDRYYAGNDLDHPAATYFMPIPCMHCEHAPCELVCPVGATMHTDDGLNAMIYNRCVGTRYCSNNCPYKVRRFNFLPFTAEPPMNYETPQLQLMANPEVTIRSRGVMEKCTYCVQRIQNAKITAEKESRLVRDGEVIPACAQACPTQTIVFGSLDDPNGQVSRLKREPHDYGLLADLSTRPRTTYLARIYDPNPTLEPE